MNMEIDLYILQLLLIQALILPRWGTQMVYQSITTGKTLYNERYGSSLRFQTTPIM